MIIGENDWEITRLMMLMNIPKNAETTPSEIPQLTPLTNVNPTIKLNVPKGSET